MALGLPWLALSLAALAHLGASSPHTCAVVRREFVQRHMGEGRRVPDAPRTGSDLQVCVSRNLTCCTRQMEERYQFTARRDVQNLLQTSSSSLKAHITHSVAGLQEAVESLVRRAQNQTVALLLSTYRDLAERAAPHVSELFTDVGLFVLGAELGLEEAGAAAFFPRPLAAGVRAAGGAGPGPPGPGLRRVRALGGPRAGAVRELSRHAGQAADPAPRSPNRVLLQALHLGVEVINTTDHLQLSRECRKALLRMSYCPHCQALTSSKPCMGYCLNVLRGLPRQPRRGGLPLEGVCALHRGAVHPDEQRDGSGAGASRRARRRPRRHRTRAQERPLAVHSGPRGVWSPQQAAVRWRPAGGSETRSPSEFQPDLLRKRSAAGDSE
ncbi:hypothetical protein MHYP_G00090010 [Metynnis hypsauchen]